MGSIQAALDDILPPSTPPNASPSSAASTPYANIYAMHTPITIDNWHLIMDSMINHIEKTKQKCGEILGVHNIKNRLKKNVNLLQEYAKKHFVERTLIRKTCDEYHIRSSELGDTVPVLKIDLLKRLSNTRTAIDEIYIAIHNHFNHQADPDHSEFNRFLPFFESFSRIYGDQLPADQLPGDQLPNYDRYKKIYQNLYTFEHFLFTFTNWNQRLTSLLRFYGECRTDAKKHDILNKQIIGASVTIWSKKYEAVEESIKKMEETIIELYSNLDTFAEVSHALLNDLDLKWNNGMKIPKKKNKNNLKSDFFFS